MDVCAAILEVAGLYLVGNRLRIGFICNILALFCWVHVSLTHGIYGLMIVSVVAFTINVRNYRKWRTS